MVTHSAAFYVKQESARSRINKTETRHKSVADFFIMLWHRYFPSVRKARGALYSSRKREFLEPWDGSIAARFA